MDTRHRFHTESTWRWVRAEHLLLLLALAGLCLWHIREVRILRFALAFVVIDVVGYLPGALAFRRGGGRVAPIYHHLYNLTHSYVTAALGLLCWAAISGPEWAMLAVPIHLAGDRGIFGNTYKPVELPFEPVSP